MPQIVHYEYHRPGRPTATFEQWLVLDRPDVKVLLSENYTGPELVVDGRVIQSPGAPMVWYVFPEKWHDVGRFHAEGGRFTGWYTNFILPVEFREDRWIGRDLFLDLWQPAEGGAVWLDEDELERAAAEGLVDAATRKRIRNERSIIQLQLGAGNWPPAIARDIELSQALALKETGT